MQGSEYSQARTLLTENESEKLELFVSCRNLTDLDFITKTDSFLVVRMMEPNKPLREILRSKVYENDLNPNYAETVIIEYFFEIRQKVVFEVYHLDQPPRLVGKAESSVGQIFGAPNNSIRRPVLNRDGKNSGEILLRFEKVEKGANKMISMDISARHLPEPCALFWCKPDPFYRIIRQRINEQLLILESQAIKNTTDPNFNRITLSERKLCHLNQEMTFQIRFFDYSRWGDHNQFGTAKVSLVELMTGKSRFDIVKNQERNGICEIRNVSRMTKYKFGDYISSGLELALITGIDFTSSNRKKEDPTSLHYIPHRGMSQYEEALYEVSKILLDYDYDKLVPVYGFGAQVSMPNFTTQNRVHHCFPLNGNPKNVEVFEVDGVMRAYRESLPYLEFGSPTHFSPLLQKAINEARQIQTDNSKYLILLILTDGSIHDEQTVISQIIDCCTLPISLIIVGIGDGDFVAMHRLDDDDCKLVDLKGRKTTRDCVQFVKFQDFKNNSIQLAREVLKQLPRQVEEYFQIRKMGPQHIRNRKNDPDINRASQNNYRGQ